MTQPRKLEEEILVVPREKLFTGAMLTGFEPMTSFTPWQKLIEEHRSFLPRYQMEEDPSYKQIIPYLVFCHEGKYFLMQRNSTASEKRLQSKRSLGIGGHIRKEDLQEKDIIGWAKREFAEEIDYKGSIDIKPLGIINDESNDVGKVHIGFAFLLEGDSSDIAIRSELKSGELLTIDECMTHYDSMETWSQLVFDHLQKMKKEKGVMVEQGIIKFLQHKALNVRINSVKATTASKSGHPTSCLSAADMVTALFFHAMKYDKNEPKASNNDRFIMSKGHAIPVVYAAYRELGIISEDDLLSLRKFDSVFEGHPTPRFEYNEAATGSLGQGLGIGLGMALNAKKENLSYRTYVMMGDGEIVEGSVWEAAALASHYKLDNLVGILDANRLAQSGSSIEDHEVEVYAQRFAAFGWDTVVIDGHNMTEIVETFEKIKSTRGKPVAVIAKTFKGYGLEYLENKNGFHGKPFKEDDLAKTINALIQRFKDAENPAGAHECSPQMPETNGMLPEFKEISCDVTKDKNSALFDMGTSMATRKAYGYALAALGRENKQVMALDADVKNSTFSEIFEKEHPERFIQCYVAEQNMVSVAAGLELRGKIPFCATFAAFFARAHDQLRMASIGRNALRVCGSHAGVSIGEDGPSQMGLEDIAMMRCIPGSVVLYPSDAVSAYKLTHAMANYHNGISYLRTTRSSTPVLYEKDEEFAIGSCKVLAQSKNDKVCIIAAGITLHEALKAHKLLLAEGINSSVIDLYSVKPFDAKTVKEMVMRAGGRVITVEDHYAEGGIGEAVAHSLIDEKVHMKMLAVHQISRSGKPDELMRYAEINAHSIIAAAQSLL